MESKLRSGGESMQRIVIVCGVVIAVCILVAATGQAAADTAGPLAKISHDLAVVYDELESYLERVMAAGLNGDKVIVHGSPYQEIVEIAKARQVDLIIMGTHGRTGLRHMLMGSVAEKVVQLASCPVLVTRQPADVARSGSLPPLPRNR